jgi:anti-anti-sigma factor
MEGWVTVALQQWSDRIVLVEVNDDPLFTEDMNALIDHVNHHPDTEVAVNFNALTFLNSSNISKLLRLRKLVTATNERSLLLCGVSNHVWGVFLVTGLDKLFEFSDDVSTALATLQMKG